MTWSLGNYPRASRDIAPGDTVASNNLIAPDGQPVIGACALAGEYIRQGDGVMFAHPYAWSVATDRG